MNQHQLSRYRRQLQDLRARVRAIATSVGDAARGPSGGQSGGALSNAPMHMGDEGSEEFLGDMNAALLENEEYLVGEIRAALARIDRGVFGICEECGRAIARVRIDAIPYTRYCVDCARINRAGVPVNLNTGRPLSPADTIAPEGAMQEDWRPSQAPAFDFNPRNVHAADAHAVGEPGGGGAIGGLAGANAGRGEPEVSDLRDAAGSGDFDLDQARDEPGETPRSGRSGGAVGGTPARKRAK